MAASVRPPCVAGLFYEASASALKSAVARYVESPGKPLAAQDWRALLLPHAGHVYSGAIAGAGVGAVEWPGTAILLGPNHRGTGRPAALSAASAWRTPLGDVPANRRLASELAAASPRVEWDDRAHEEEHSLEVLLPFLQAVRPDITCVWLSLGAHDLSLCLDVGRAVARAIRGAESRGERVALVTSSDLNHYLPRERNRARDDRAVDALLHGDPAELFDRVLLRENISMCGILPATAMLEALRDLGGARAKRIAQGDSGDAFGDTSRVVGYASVLWET